MKLRILKVLRVFPPPQDDGANPRLEISNILKICNETKVLRELPSPRMMELIQDCPTDQPYDACYTIIDQKGELAFTNNV